MQALKSLSGIAHWLPRLALAAIFLYHGGTKFPMAQGMAEMMGMPVMMVYLLGTMECLGALLILWGGAGPEWATQVGGLIFSVVMLGAIVMVHAQFGWNSINMGDNGGHGMEFQVLILATSLYFVFKGDEAR
ncbi:MAG: DoxX family protein [Acidobacteriota bacterium]